MKTKQKFVEVHSDYQDPETGNIAIDAYLTNDDETPGRTVCWVSPDGEIIKGTNPECEKDDLECSVVQEAIADAKNTQEENKQKLVDDVIEDLKDSFKHGDYTVLDELLKFIPSKNLIQALPEEKWKNYPIEIK
jgi:hypothetical protein